MNEPAEAVFYNRFFELGGNAFRRHGDILDLRVEQSLYGFLARMYRERYPGGCVLDFGCGVRKPAQEALELSDSTYRTCDNDPGGSFTYADPVSIPASECFDMVISNHTFEHLPFETGVQIARLLAGHVKPGGVMVIGVPNPKHPTRYRSDPTHKTPWSYLNLCALMELGGLDACYCARTHKHRPPFILARPFVNWICRTFMMDWCDSIFVVGRRTE